MSAARAALSSCAVLATMLLSFNQRWRSGSATSNWPFCMSKTTSAVDAGSNRSGWAMGHLNRRRVAHDPPRMGAGVLAAFHEHLAVHDRAVHAVGMLEHASKAAGVIVRLFNI